jgi:hypothetical protein
MKPPPAIEMLDLWEDTLASTPARRALALLMAALPELGVDTLTAWTIGHRDAELLRLRELLFGRRMAAIAACESCRQKLELALDTQQMLSSRAPELALPGGLSLDLDGFSLSFRLPTTLDLLAAEAASDAETARGLILDRCLLAAEYEGAKAVSEDLPGTVIAGIARAMAEADPLADIQLRLNCPGCGHSWRAAFDIVSFLWTELDAWARRILSEVHVLARAYGWAEREIVALGPARRRYYLEMVGA